MPARPAQPAGLSEQFRIMLKTNTSKKMPIVALTRSPNLLEENCAPLCPPIRENEFFSDVLSVI